MKNILIAVLMVFIGANFACAERAFIERVVDGNTLKLLDGQYVKLIGIDQPQYASDSQEPLSQSQTDKIAAADKEKAAFIRSLVSGSVVELEYDAQKQDAQGNLLAYVWFEFESNEKGAVPDNYDLYLVDRNDGSKGAIVFLNSTMIKSGYAKPVQEAVNTKHAQLFQKIYEDRSGQMKMAQADANPILQASLEKAQ